jgi:hypothetical protein
MLAYKYPGFCFGMGRAETWPADRLGGVTPASPYSISTEFNLAKYSTATHFQLVVTAPSGVQTTSSSCTVSPCVSSIDGRQGISLVVGQWLNAGNAVVGQTLPFKIAPL